MSGHADLTCDFPFSEQRSAAVVCAAAGVQVATPATMKSTGTGLFIVRS